MESFIVRDHPFRKRKAPVLFDETEPSQLPLKSKKALRKQSKDAATKTTAKLPVHWEPLQHLPDITVAAPIDNEAIKSAIKLRGTPSTI